MAGPNYARIIAIVDPAQVQYDLGPGMSSQFISSANPLGRVPTASAQQSVVSDGTGAYYVINTVNAQRLVDALRVSVGNPEVSVILSEDATIPGFVVRDPTTGETTPWDGTVTHTAPPPVPAPPLVPPTPTDQPFDGVSQVQVPVSGTGGATNVTPNANTPGSIPYTPVSPVAAAAVVDGGPIHDAIDSVTRTLLFVAVGALAFYFFTRS